MNTNSKLLVGLLAAAFVIGLVPTTGANVGNPGTLVEGFHVDTVHPLLATQTAAACTLVGGGNCFGFVDADGDTAHDTEETAYMNMVLTGAETVAAPVVSAFDVRLT